MKKIALWLSATFIAVTLFACGGSTPELETRLKELDEADSFTATMTTSGIPFFGDIQITLMMEGDIGYTTTSMFGMAAESYMVIEDDLYVTYTKASEETRWEREIVNEHEYQFNKDIMEKLEAAWFIVEDGVYVLEEAHHVDVMEE